MKEIKTQFDLTDHIQNSVDIKHFTSMEKLVLLTIAGHTNPANQWEGWPSLDTLQRLCCATRPTVTKAVKHLTEMGVLSYKKGKTNVSNKYKVVLDKLNNFTEEKACYGTAKRVKKYEPDEDFENAPF